MAILDDDGIYTWEVGDRVRYDVSAVHLTGTVVVGGRDNVTIQVDGWASGTSGQNTLSGLFLTLIEDYCDGVICEDTCFGTDMYSTVCYNGECVKDSLIKANDPACGYVSPSPEDSTLFDMVYDNKEIIALGTIGGILFIVYS